MLSGALVFSGGCVCGYNFAPMGLSIFDTAGVTVIPSLRDFCFSGFVGVIITSSIRDRMKLILNSNDGFDDTFSEHEGNEGFSYFCKV